MLWDEDDIRGHQFSFYRRPAHIHIQIRMEYASFSAQTHTHAPTTFATFIFLFFVYAAMCVSFSYYYWIHRNCGARTAIVPEMVAPAQWSLHTNPIWQINFRFHRQRDSNKHTNKKRKLNALTNEVLENVASCVIYYMVHSVLISTPHRPKQMANELCLIG